MEVDNYYELLEIDPTADTATIETALRKKRSRYRQVTGSPNKEHARNAEVMIEKLAQAQLRLLDPQARKNYDEQLRSQPAPVSPEPIQSSNSTWLESAKAYLANGQPRNAARAAMEATREQPNDVDAWTVRAYAALEIKDYRDADFSASEALRRNSDDPQIHGLLGEVFDAEGRWAEAEQAFARAAQLDPTNPYWYGRVAWAIADQGRVDEAITFARGLVARNPLDQYARDTLALQLLRYPVGVLSVNAAQDTYYTSRKQVSYVESRVSEVRALGPLSPNATAVLSEAIGNLASAKRRQFVWPGVGAFIKYFFAWLVLMVVFSVAFGGFLQFLLVIGTTAGLAWRFFGKVLPTQWSVNQAGVRLGALTPGLR